MALTHRTELKAGIIGAGAIARSHADAYAAVPGVRLVAVADLDPAIARELADLHGARAFADGDELLCSDVDVVSVCTPPLAHAELAVTALEAGKHVLCEKPLARTAEQAESIVAAAGGSDGILMVGHVSRFQRDLRLAQRLLRDGRLGRLVMASDSIVMTFPGELDGSWHADHARSGGVLLDVAIHSLDYLAWLFDEPAVRVHAVGAPAGRPDARYVLINIRFAGGGIGRVEASWAQPPGTRIDGRTELVGTLASIGWTLSETAGLVLSGARDRWFSYADATAFVEEIGAFVDAVRAGGPSPVPASAGLDALRLALAAARSLETGETVALSAEPIAEPA